MSISIGVVGKPNAGKSTLFSALTMADAKIAPFPFTTIEPNRAVAYIRKPCPHGEIGKQCTPRDSSCVKGVRFIPIQITDVAGLVPDAHLGKGLGLQFLDDIRQADALIQVVDASGRTDLEGNASEGCEPTLEVEFLEKEMTHWIAGILERNWAKVGGKPASALYDVFSSMKIGHAHVEAAVRKLGLPETLNWKEDERFAFAEEMRRVKPVLIAANKWDIASGTRRLMDRYEGNVVRCAAAYELALRKAA
ncbi:MAG: 50S ribosome-binding GTPase [Candidatus ainarchaeum sp.]|nr:50S ribosome-binding GTPase [Candidatus ainarchaeum sp.]